MGLGHDCMPADFLTYLPISAEERDKLSQFAAPDAAALLGMIQAAPEDFRRFYGDRETTKLVSALTRIASSAQQRDLNKKVAEFPISGAIQGRPAPQLPPPDFDVERRDALFESLEALRKIPKPDAAVQVRIEHLERELNEMLDR